MFHKNNIFIFYIIALIAELIPGSVVLTPGAPVHNIILNYSYFSIEPALCWNVTPALTFIFTILCLIFTTVQRFKPTAFQGRRSDLIPIISVLTGFVSVIAAILNFRLITVCISVLVLVPGAFFVIRRIRRTDVSQ